MFIKVLLPALAVAVAAQDYAGQYRTEFGSTVVPPFNQAVSIYQANILEHISTINTDIINKDPESVAKDLNCNTNKLLSFLKTCVSASDSLKTKMDQSVVQLTQQASGFSSQLTSLNQQLATHKSELASNQAALNAANAQLAQAQAVVNAAAAKQAEEQRRYDKSREGCIGKRGLQKRGFHLGHIIHKITRPITKPIEKAICHVLNHGGIDNAKAARNRADGVLNNARTRVTQIQGQVNQKNAQIAAVNTQIAQITASRNQVNVQLTKVLAQQSSVTVIDTQVKRAMAKVTLFLGKAQVLKTVIDQMIDFNGLLVPMSAINDQLKTFNQQGTYLPVDQAKVNQATANLKLLQSKLPAFPFVENAPGC